MKSFALGFVKGLTNGFTRNIAMEQEARGADDARVADIENLMIQASLDPKKRVPQEVGNMLKDAQGQLNKREPIDIFGREGPRLKLDMDKIAGIMKEVDPDDVIKYITYGYDKKNQYEILPTTQDYFKDTMIRDNLASSEIWLKSFDKHFQNTENVTKFTNFMNKKGNELLKNKFLKDWTRITGDYKELTGKSFTNEGVPATKFPTLMERFTTPGLLKDLIEAGPSEEMQEITLAKKYVGETDPSFNFDKDTILLQSSDQSWRPYKFIDDENGLTSVEKMTALKKLAKNFTKSGDVNEYIALLRKQNQKDLVDFRGQGVKIDPDTKKVITDQTIFRTVDPDTFRANYEGLFHAINLEHLGASKSLANDDLSPAFQYLKTNFVKENSDGVLEFDGRNAIRALASVIQVPESDLEQIRSQTDGVEVRQTDKFIEDIFLRMTNSTLKDFTARWDATKKTMNALNELKRLKGETDLPSSGFIPVIRKIFGNITIPTGVIDQIGGFISGRGKLKSGTTQASLQEIITKSGLAKDVANLSTQEALMIALAADMARAVDPSGRLSNQDFEVQLRRLGQGGFFTSKISESAALQTVIDDFQTRYDQLEMISLVVADSTGAKKNLTKRDLQILHANKKFYAMKQVNQGDEVVKPKLTLQDKYKDDDGDEVERFLIITGVNLGPPSPNFPNGRPTRAIDRKTNKTYNIVYDKDGNMMLGTELDEENV